MIRYKEERKAKGKRDPELTKKFMKARDERGHLFYYKVNEGEDPSKVKSIASRLVMVDQEGMMSFTQRQHCVA